MNAINQIRLIAIIEHVNLNIFFSCLAFFVRVNLIIVHRQFGVTLQGPYQRPGAPGAVVSMSQPWSHISRSGWPRANRAKIWGQIKTHTTRAMPSALFARRQDPRAQFTSAIHGRNYRAINHAQSITRNQLRNCRRCSCLHIILAQKSHESFDFAIQITMVWASGKRGSNRSVRKFVRISNIKIILFVETFLAPQMQASRRPPGAPRAGLGPLEPSQHLEIGGPVPQIANVLLLKL